MTTAFVGLGSNLGDRLTTLAAAAELLDDLPTTRVVDVSAVYETAPVGDVDQGEFLNAVARVETDLGPRALLAQLHDLEAAFGRDRSAQRRWGPRPLDLDLLLYGDVVVDDPGLTLPHPRLAERAFVLVPLVEVAPGWTLPGGPRLTQLLAALAPVDGVEFHVRLEEAPRAGGVARPEGPRGPGAFLASQWPGERPGPDVTDPGPDRT